MKKFLLILISTTFLANIFLSLPATTHAVQVEVINPVFIANPILFTSDVPNKVVAAAHTKLTAAGWIAEATRWGKDLAREIALTIKKSAFALFKKRVLDRMVDDLVQWITYGDDKKPKWAEGDFEELTQNAAQAAIGDLVLKTSLAQICSPFKAKLLLTLTPPGPVSDQVKCTLDQITGNINSFLADFKNGGWLAYNELWQPRNNYYATVLMTLDSAGLAGARAAAAQQSEVIAGQGFLATTRCDYYPDPDGIYKDKFGHALTDQDLTAMNNGEWVNTYSRKCYKTTPGSTIAGLALKANTTYIDWLINAEDIDAYVTAVADALINRVIKDGVNGLKGLSNKKPDAPQQSPGRPCDGLTGAALASCLGYDNISQINYINNRSALASQSNDSIEPRQKASTLLTQVISKQSTLVTALENLYTCQQSTGFTQEAKDTQLELDVEKDKLSIFCF